MQHVILMCGVAQSGKDTLFPFIKARIEKELGGNWLRFAFADKLKEECESEVMKRYGVSVWDDSQKDIFRPYLIEYGERRRDETEGMFLIDHLINDVTEFPENNYLVTDYRFFNEYCDYGGAKVTPVYLQRFIWQGSTKFVIEPTIPQEIKQYHLIRNHPHTVTWEVPWVSHPKFDTNSLTEAIGYLELPEN